ncbi:type VI secretion system baseplate subunit TssF [Sorangium sp. So ce513]|uniref:type VI secretion system baseplate subunit TssF n=1 Tax=Sorangium sp. So ce513 TaxID=3133315 RepID=UPI003F62F52B
MAAGTAHIADEELESAFLEELASLERFRIAYTGLYPGTPLSREDPDVRRLLEGMALFSARTRLAADRGLHRSVVRLFRQHFSYLLGPAPALGMLRATPTAQLADAAELPRGAEAMLVAPASSRGGEARAFRFRTLARLRILPIELAGVNLLRVRGRGYRILLRFTKAFESLLELGDLSLHVNHLDDLASSIAVLHALEAHCTGASVVFDADVHEDTAGTPCDVDFGPPSRAGHEISRADHPLRDARAALRFPRQDLYINVRGLAPKRSFRRFTICLDLDEGWPRELHLNADGLELFVVPMVNERIDMANPIEHDGTRERHAVRHPDDAARFVPSTVLGVYRIGSDGLAPLEPAVVPDRLCGDAGAPGARRESYDVAYEGRGDQRRAWLALSLPGAVEKPQRVAVEAVWHQPSIRDVSASDLAVRLAERYIAGVSWSCSGALSPPVESEIEDDRDSLFELLSLKSQRALGPDELRFLLRALGTRAQPQFDRLVSALAGADMSRKPFAKSTSGFKCVYRLEFEGLTPSELPRLHLFCRKLLDVLRAWSVEEVVELVARVSNLGEELRFGGP